MFGTRRADEAHAIATGAEKIAALAMQANADHVKFCMEREMKRDVEHQQNLVSFRDIRSALNRLMWGALGLVLTVLGFILSQALHFKISVG